MPRAFLKARSALALLATAACAGSSSAPTSSNATSSTPGTSTPNTSTSLPPGYDKFINGATARVDGDFVVVSTTDVPNHPSPYFGAGNAMYEAPQAGMQVNPNRIAAQSYVFRIPRTPGAAATPSDTPLGAIGVALNGVVFFNQYAAGRTPLGPEIVSFDRYNGHPAQRNEYHYHLEPVFLTASSKSALLGFMLDGLPLYGPLNVDGTTPTGLDACNGHSHATAEYPGGIYHYHVLAAPPYLVGCYKGTPGTVTN